MNTAPALTTAHLERSVMAVPPLARTADGTIDPAANQQIIRHIEAGGVSLLLYGGNANIYHLPLAEYEPLLGMLAETAGAETIVVPAAGPTYGLLLEHAKVIRQHRFQTVMVLPQQGITTSAGVATGVRKFVETAGVPALLYIKHDGYIEPADAARLCADGLISAIKYATVRDDPHLRNFGLGGFTTGCGCVAPALSQTMLGAIRRRDWDEAESIRKVFEPLEDLRNGINPIRVLHEAVAAAGIAPTGPLLPLLSAVEEEHCPAIAVAAKALLAAQD
ncbi:MAG: dihydrodipicolinate synthase family protein [Planctomycetia bacterium]|nr:dihydrodipicolinate synthase family protein [Planctomycetia bacterium]